MRAENLSCNDLRNPLGVETRQPRLSWMLDGGQRQTAYRIVVDDRWDSGRVESEQSVHVAYAGPRLVSRQACSWKVQVWDQDGQSGPWSEPASWEMGLLNATDWQARWIAGERLAWGELKPAPLLRRRLELRKSVVAARVYVSGLGYYELYVNGRRIGDEVLAPAFSRYDLTTFYQTHDVIVALRAGENVFGVILGSGWYNCHTQEVWNFHAAPWRDQPKLLLQLHLRFEDEEEQIVVSDQNWRANTAPIVFDGLRNGEFYDARLEQPGWNAPGFDDTAWKPAVQVPPPGGVLRSQQHTPMRVTETLRHVSVKEAQPGVWVYDLGQNIAGWNQLTVAGSAGTTVTLKHAEKLKPDGDIDPSNINPFVKSGEFQTDKYTLRGAGKEVWEPRFTYHGFQYVQVTGFPGAPTRDNLRGRVAHTALETRGEFSCSNDLLNAIQRAALWATRGNFHGNPTDCPHREKNGWTGDAHLSAEQVLLNFDPRTAYRKWMGDFRDVQRPSGQLPGIVPTGGWGYNWGSGPAWDSAAILIPWYLHLSGGDTATLAEHYDCMKRYVDYMTTMATDHIVEFGLGDWCPPTGGPSGHKCPVAVTDTAYYYVDASILAKVAGLLGKKADARRYERLAAKIRRAFRKKFLNRKTGQVTGNCQTSMACALYQGLVDEEEKPRVLAALVAAVEEQNRHLDFGILGLKYVLRALTDGGRVDLAYALATQMDFPSWGHWLMQGATTLWEMWDGEGSHNHHMASDISAWFYQTLAGINPDPAAPGFKHILLRPRPVADLRWVRAWHLGPYGRMESNWTWESGAFTLDALIPPNCTATVYLPSRDQRAPVRLESGRHQLTATF